MPQNPPIIGEPDPVPAKGQVQIIDTAKFLIGPGTIRGPGDATPGQLMHIRPYITNGTRLFGFPVGPEGFRVSGNASVGLHRFIGGQKAAGNTIHFGEERVELTGIFPGITSVEHMHNCREILRSKQTSGIYLWAPGVLDRMRVLPENWDFGHDADDKTHSITYTISFVILDETRNVKDPHGKPPPEYGHKKPKGKPHKIFVVKSGARTFRAIAKLKYKKADKKSIQKLIQLNQGLLNKWKKKHPKIPTHKLPDFRWPVGTKVQY